MTDFKYYIWFHHPVISIFRASKLDTYTRCERLVLLTIIVMVNFLLTSCTIYIDMLITKCHMDFAEPDANLISPASGDERPDDDEYA